MAILITITKITNLKRLCGTGLVISECFGFIYQKKLINIYIPNDVSLNYLKQFIIDLNKDIDINIIVDGGFDIILEH